MKSAVETARLSSDPFVELHSDVHDMILQHFRGKDVLELFKVSKEWNQRTVNSAKMLQKIKLNLKDPSRAAVTLLLKSQRHHRNMKFQCLFLTNSKRKLMLMTNFPLIVELEINIKNRVLKNLDLKRLEFPHLRKLRFVCEYYDPAVEIGVEPLLKRFLESKCLEKLSLDFPVPSLEFLQLLAQNKTLKTLTLEDHCIWYFGEGALSNARFKLKTFRLHDEVLEIKYFSEDMKQFIASMSGSLTTLGVDDIHVETADFIAQQTNIKHLKVVSLWFFGEDLGVIEPNPNVEKITISSYCFQKLREVLQIFKNVKFIKAKYFDIKHFKTIIENLPGLIEIQTSDTHQIDTYQEIFDEVRQATPGNLNQLKITNERGTFILKQRKE